MGRLEGKVAVITGAARGIGAAAARRMADEGAKVVFTDILAKEGEALAGELGPGCKFMRHDVTNSLEWANVIAETEKAFGPVNILVNNAGIFPQARLEKTTDEEFLNAMNVNAFSAFLGIKAVLPSMRKAGGGSIVNTSSVFALKGTRGSLAYTASKWAVRGISRSAALELARDNIRVNAVFPGLIDTPMISQAAMDGALSAGVIPFKRPGEPEDIANMIVFLASDESRYCTGAEFVVDGGMTA